MIAFLWTALTSRAAGPIASALAILLLGFSGCQTVRLAAVTGQRDAAEQQLADVQSQYDRCKANRSALETSIREQNAEVESFARIQSERVAAAERAAQAAAKGRVDAQLRAAKLLKTQPQGVDACSRFMSADRAVLDSLR